MTESRGSRDNLIEIADVCFQRNSHAIFTGINMSIATGKVTSIMGPSGTGKTTLLRLIGAQLYPTSGKVLVAGQNIHELRSKDVYKLRKKMGMLFQNGGLFTHLSVFDNVAFPLREHTRLSEAMVRSIVLMKLQMVGLRGARDLMPSELSGGMARRVALARAIALDPELIMYDEPLTGQDPISMGVLVELIHMLNKTLGLTSIIVSHDVQEILRITDYAYIIADGSVIGSGSADAIQHNESPQLQQFLQGLPDGPVPFHYPAVGLTDDLLKKDSA